MIRQLLVRSVGKKVTIAWHGNVRPINLTSHIIIPKEIQKQNGMLYFK